MSFMILNIFSANIPHSIVLNENMLTKYDVCVIYFTWHIILYTLYVMIHNNKVIHSFDIHVSVIQKSYVVLFFLSDGYSCFSWVFRWYSGSELGDYQQCFQRQHFKDNSQNICSY